MAIRELHEDTKEILYDVCIVGSGPAGLTLAAELKDSKMRVCVLESGLMKKTAHADKLREVKSSGDILIRNSSRERVFGGTSTTWAGLSSPLDPIDFTRWPIQYAELKPYYDRASAYGFPRESDFLPGVMEHLRTEDDFTKKLSGFEEKIFIAGDPPWNFGKKLHYIFSEKNIDLFLGATVARLRTTKKDGATTITEAEIQKENGEKMMVAAKIFILAAGGLESTRILLASKIGNENGQVGKYLTNHPKGFFGIIHLHKKVRGLPHLFGYLKDGRSQYIGLRLHEKTQKDRGLRNSYLRFEPMFLWTDNPGVEALIILMKKTKFFLAWWKRRQKGVVALRDWNETGDDNKLAEKVRGISTVTLIPKIIFHLPGVALYSLHRLLPKREVGVKRIRIRNFMDMESREENRLTLDDQGLPHVRLTLSRRDKNSLLQLHRHLADELGRLGIGKIEGDLGQMQKWPISSDASHHLGGTIMGDNPKKSVVDRNLKVHSVSNLYIASGSVFPSPGNANPTYTICALSIRLAEHLKNNPLVFLVENDHRKILGLERSDQHINSVENHIH